jgi:hypothetical protein
MILFISIDGSKWLLLMCPKADVVIERSLASELEFEVVMGCPSGVLHPLRRRQSREG